jgi:hypothetical protein
MTDNKHFKDTVRLRQYSYGLTYQQTRRQIIQQLRVLDDFTHLPVIWEVARHRGRRIPTVAQHRAALGAVELALRATDILAGATERDRWRAIDGHIDLDWHGGPYAYEVVHALITFAEEPDTGTVDPGELSPGVDRCGDLNAVWINGVRVRFRPYRPIGAAASHKLAWSSLFAHTGKHARDEPVWSE